MLGGVSLEAVLQLLGCGRLLDVQDPIPGGDIYAVAQGKIPGGQGLEIHHGPAAVREHVEELHGDPVSIVEHPQTAAAHLLPGHEGQGVGIVLLDPGRRRDLLQIVPIHAPPEPKIEGREPGHELVHRPLQELRVHVLRQGHGLPKDVVPILAADGGKDQGRIVQRHPNLSVLTGHGSILLSKNDRGIVPQRTKRRNLCHRGA